MHCPILGIIDSSPRDSAGWSRSGGFPPCYQPDKYYVVSDGDYDGDGVIYSHFISSVSPKRHSPSHTGLRVEVIS